MTSTDRLLIDPSLARTPAGAAGRLSVTDVVANAAAMLALFACGAVGFSRVFDSLAGYRAAFGGIILGVLIGVVSVWRRWGPLPVAGLIALAYLLFGTALALPSLGAAGIVPTVTSVRRLLLLIVQGWRDLLTVAVPADDFVGPAVVPFLAGLVLATIATHLASSERRPLLALAPALAFLVIGILWGAKNAQRVVIPGALFYAVALGWGAWRTARARKQAGAGMIDRDGGFTSSSVRRLLAGAATILLAGGLASASAPILGATANRHILRDDVVPPFDPRAYPSPLTQYRYLESLETEVLLRVTGLPPGGRLRLATLDAYDGDVYHVDSASAGYQHIGSRVDVGGRDSEPTNVAVTIGKYSGIWLPGGGDVRGVIFHGEGATARGQGLYYNSATGTLLTTAGLQKGAAYDVRLVMPAEPSKHDLATAGIRPVALPATSLVPDQVATLATGLAGDASTPYDQLSAIANRLRSDGYYSNGTKTKSRSGHTAERLAAMLGDKVLIGDDEQFAVLMTLMARSLGYPARVVMGFYPESDAPAGQPIDLTGADVHVWVEVAFQPDAWVSFDPTPDKDREPEQRVEKPRKNPIPQVMNPPDPPRSDADRPLDYQGVKKPPEEPPSDRIWLTVLRYAALAAAGLGVLSAPLWLILLAKRRRRRRRRTAPRLADRASGSWEELRDATIDLGEPARRSATRREHAVALLERFPDTDAGPVARGVDAVVFAPSEPSDTDVTAMWRQVDELLRGIRRSVPRARRIRAALSLASLRQRPASSYPRHRPSRSKGPT